MSDIKILAIDYEQSPKSIMELVEEATKLHKDSPLIIALPESVFGDYALKRHEVKSIMTHIHNALKKHGNAFLFTSVIEKSSRLGGRFSISNTGYIVTPNKNKPWIVYPKTTHYTNYNPPRPTLIDAKIIYDNSGNNLSTVDKLYEMWNRRARRIKDYPQIEINGKKIQLRVCADVSVHDKDKYIVTGDPTNKVDLIIVPAETYPAKDFFIENLPLKQRGKVLIVDKTQGLSMADSAHKFPARLRTKLYGFDGFSLHARPNLDLRKKQEPVKTQKKPLKSRKRTIFRRRR